ncbi:MAG: hypothetical protein NVSMB64_30970 [Candidatus Velthaea sp.]
MAASVNPVRSPIKYPTAQELAAARKRGREAMAEEPHAVSATYDAARDALSLRFSPDALLIIEHVRKALPELSQLTDSELAKVEVVGSGETLIWSESDIAIGVSALAARFVGTRGIRRAALREIAATPSARKAAAARENGMLGGRPPAYGVTQKTAGSGGQKSTVTNTPARKVAAKKGGTSN